MKKKTKKILIIFIYFLIFLSLVFGIYFVVKPDPNCNDGKLNQNEEKIDCGGSCQACKKEIKTEKIQIKETAMIYGGPGKYDVMIRIYNPNHDYGSSEFDYEIILKDIHGEEIVRRKSTGFILPRETKYYIETNFETDKKPNSFQVKIDNLEWEKFSGYEEPNLNIYNKSYTEASSGNIYNEVYGLLRNESLYDFKSVLINVILRDSSGNPVAVNKNEMQMIGSQEERDLRLIWPYDFGKEVANVEIEAESNVFDSENFINQKSSEKEKFQEYMID